MFNALGLREGGKYVEDKNEVEIVALGHGGWTQEEFNEYNLEQYPNLKKLDCSNSEIIDIGNHPNLEWLNCSNTKIKEITGCPKLKYIACQNTSIDAINLSK